MNIIKCIKVLLYSFLLSIYLVECQRVSSTKRVLRRYKVCSGARCESLKSLSPFAALSGGDNLDFLHYSRWTSWSPCSRHCSTRRYRACRFPLSCGTTIIHEEAFCYRRGTHCELIYESSLGDFFAQDHQQYDEHGVRSSEPVPQLQMQMSSEWISEYDDVVAPAPRISKKKIRRQPKKYSPFADGTRRKRPRDRERHQNQNRTNLMARRHDDLHDLQAHRAYLGLGPLGNNDEFNGPFPVDDYNDEPNYNYNVHNSRSNFGHHPFLTMNSNSNEEEFTCGIAKIAPSSSRTYGLSRRILGGSEAVKGRWPWQVAILNRMQEAFCGGTLIAPRWILTAAHCVRRRIYVTIGEHHLHRNDDTEKHYTIEAAFIHPDFETDTVDSDIALLLLPEPVPTQLGLACLPFENQALPSPNTACTILGWGKQKYNHVFGTHALQEGKVPIVSNGECRYAYGQYEITSNMFCAGYSHGTVDSCAGDSGGPLLCTDDENRWTVHGVTSFGDGCGRKGKYGIYAKVSNYVAWIKKVMQVNHF